MKQPKPRIWKQRNRWLCQFRRYRKPARFKTWKAAMEFVLYHPRQSSLDAMLHVEGLTWRW